MIVLGNGESVSLDASVAVRAQREAGFAREERLTVEISGSALLHHTKEFSENTTNTPHINSLTVVFLEENELGCTVPPGHDVTSKLTLHVLALIFGRLELLEKLSATVCWCSFLLLLFCCSTVVAGAGTTSR